MALYAIGDLHLSFQTDKSMEVFGREWKDYVKKISKNYRLIFFFVINLNHREVIFYGKMG